MKFSLNIFYSLLGKKGHRVGEQMPEDLENSFFQKRAELKEKDRVTKLLPRLRRRTE